MTALPDPRPIAEYEGVDRRRFDEEIRSTGQPAILRGLAAGWPVVRAGRASPEAAVAYLKRFAHDEPVTAIVGAPEIEGRFFYTPDLKALNFTRGQSPLAPLLDRLLRDREVERPYAMAVQSAPAPELLPGFAAENATDLVDAEVTPRLWLGNAIRVATHYDLMENIGIVAIGRRRFTLFPPDQTRNLYIGPLEFTPAGAPVSMVDPEQPDFERFPRAREAIAAAEVAELGPGDALYIPHMWWHHVRSLDGLSVLVNYWWNEATAPQPGLAPVDAMVHAALAFADLPAEQRAAWRAMFDQVVFADEPDALAAFPPERRGLRGTLDAATKTRLRRQLGAIMGR